MNRESLLQRISALFMRGSDLQAPLLFVVVIGMLIVPMPGWMLDLFLIVNIGLTFTILLRTATVSQSLEFSVFPALLLITTLLRLALNISATRLILGSSDPAGAGMVIHAFGTFVVQENPIVGVVIFAILVVIQFVVITAGAGRVAEVAARFTLDAMPGKQMAIDADLNAGLIDEQEARHRRSTISREADFYGAMDGASKFVRGDAIAAIIMIVINVLGGFAVGVFMHQLSLVEALHQYTLKTVGEGIVTQIPALIMSIATGLIVTRAASESNLGKDLAQQVLGDRSILVVTAVILTLFMLIPGLPKWPFVIGGLVIGGLAFYQRRMAGRRPAQEAPTAEPVTTTASRPTTISTDEMLGLLTVDPIELEIGYGLVYLADPAQGGDLLERITNLRRQIVMELGIIVPPMRVRDNIQLRSNNYAVKLWGVEVAHGDIHSRSLLAMGTDLSPDALPGAIPTTEPAFGLPAFWISEQLRSEAEMRGMTVVDPGTVLITHISEIIRSHASEILTRQDVQMLLDKVRAAAPALVDELVPKMITLSEIHRVLQNLLKERVSLRDMNRILSTLGDHITATRDIDQLTEYVRQALARAISQQHRGTDGIIDVFTIDPVAEEMMIEHLRPTQFGTQVVLDPTSAQKLLLSIKAQADRAITMGNQPILLCSSQIRPYLRRLIEKYIPTLIVLSHAEIAAGVQVRSSGNVTIA